MIYKVYIYDESYDTIRSIKNALESHSAISYKHMDTEKCHILHTFDGEITLHFIYVFNPDDCKGMEYIVSGAEMEYPTIVYKDPYNTLVEIAQKIKKDYVCLMDAPSVNRESVLLDAIMDYLDDVEWSINTKTRVARLLQEEIESDM